MEKYSTSLKEELYGPFLIADMLASFKKFKTYNRKHGKIRKSNERKGTQSFIKAQPFGEYMHHQLGPEAPQSMGKDEAT